MRVSPCQGLASQSLCQFNFCDWHSTFPHKQKRELLSKNNYHCTKFRPQKEQLIVVSTDLLYSEKASTFLFKRKTWSVMQEASCFLSCRTT
ncbi:hypothetical protein Peur_037727 [Populus x canadensis]